MPSTDENQVIDDFIAALYGEDNTLVATGKHKELCFVPDPPLPFGNKSTSNGQWARTGSDSWFPARLIGVMGASDLGEYASMTHSWKDDFTYRNVQKQNYRFNVTMPEDAPASARNAWNAQLLNLNNVQRTKEGQPLVEDVLLGWTPDVTKPYRINGFTKTVDGRTTISLVSPRLWISPKDRPDELPTDLMPEGQASNTSVPASKEPQITLASWPDPKNYGTQTLPNADRTRRNTAFDMLDIKGDLVPHQSAPLAFRPGTWVIADCRLKFFDMTKPTHPSMGNHTYQLALESIQVIKESSEAVYQEDLTFAESAVAAPGPSTNRKRKADPESMIKVLTPPKRRKFPTMTPPKAQPKDLKGKAKAVEDSDYGFESETMDDDDD